jgi:hypothetical protein
MRVRHKRTYFIFAFIATPVLSFVLLLLLYAIATEWPQHSTGAIIAMVVVLCVAYADAIIVGNLKRFFSLDFIARSASIPYWCATDSRHPNRLSEAFCWFVPIFERQINIPFSEIKTLSFCKPAHLHNCPPMYAAGSLARDILEWQLDSSRRHKLSNLFQMRTFWEPDMIFILESGDRFIFRPLYTENAGDMAKLTTEIQKVGVRVLSCEPAMASRTLVLQGSHPQ